MTIRQDKFKIRVKTELMKGGSTITTLARTIGKSRSKTSKAINHGGYPLIAKAIRKELAIR